METNMEAYVMFMVGLLIFAGTVAAVLALLGRADQL